MNFKEISKTNKRNKSLIGVSAAVIAFFVVFLFTAFVNNQKQYFQSFASSEDADHDRGALGMAQYFFNARKNITTNKMDYVSMVAADMADRAMSKSNMHTPGSLGTFNWTSMGPTNIGGRTRAILIDQNDPTHQTIFAGGVSGGIWKSTNGGATWDNTSPALSYSINDTMQNINIGCIAQDAQGAIYIGTGEGFSVSGYSIGQGYSSGILGGGIFKSTDDGKTWRLLPKTKPVKANNSVAGFAYTNRIAILPDSFKVIYAATDSGLFISHDSGASWSITKTTSYTLKYTALDVKISNDGSVVVACVGGTGYYCYPKSGPDNIFTEMKTTGYGKLPNNGSRIEFAIAPSDPNRIYASFIDGSGQFGQYSSGNSGIYMTETALTNGGYWYDIGPGGSLSFNPYAEPTVGHGDQSTYDNTDAVFPNNEGALLCGGTTLWKWIQSGSTDTIGSWTKISDYWGGSTDPKALHPDLHTLVFDPTNSDVLFIGCDGGIFKSTNATNAESSNPDTYMSFQPFNRNYNVTQYYTVCFSPQVTYNVDGIAEGFGLGGGTQDNGSPVVFGEDLNYPYDGVDVTGGDGSGCVVSTLNPNIGYGTSDDGSLGKCGNLSTLTQLSSAYTSTIGDSIGANIDSVADATRNPHADVCFVFPVALYENPYDTLNHDSIKFTATKNYNAGDTVWPLSENGGLTYPYKLPTALSNGGSIQVPDRVVSRLAIGFDGYNGVWINGQGASNGNVTWMPIGGRYSSPYSYSENSYAIHSIAWSPDGDALFTGDEGGGLVRFSNINALNTNKFISGALFYEKPGHGDIQTHNTTVVSSNLSSALSSVAGAGRNILSIAVDPQDGNNILVTEGNYGQTKYVFYSTNALSNSPTFKSVQGNLPDMPVYGAVLDIRNADGSWNTNSAMLATEHGIYTTADITAGSVVWSKNNKGMANCLALAIKQQTAPGWLCNNEGDIYVGTHGRGLWVSTDNYQAPTAVPTITATSALNNLLVYPNPMSNEGTIEFTLAASDKVFIKIYDMEGKEVKTLDLETQSAGNHVISFESASLQPGVYFASLTGTNFRKVSKFVVAK